MTFANILYTVILYPLVQIIKLAFMVYEKAFDNTGIAILGVSVTVTLLCLPLYIVAEHWQEIERNTQKRLAPYTKRIKQAFKGDEQYMILSTYYRQNHYHPIMALRSSFGLLIQIPFFMAAYSCLSHLPALQGESFLFIRDMGQQDAIFTIGSFPVNILPIAMTAINMISGTIYTKGLPIKEKVQVYGMAIIFLVLLYDRPAGLVLYWTMNNVLSLVKNIFYKMKNPVKVLYFCMCAAVIAADVYLLFIYSGGANLTKRLMAVLVLLIFPLIPLFLKAINRLLNNSFVSITSNSKLRFQLFFYSAFALCILTGFVIPSSIIASSVQEFSNIGSVTNPAGFLVHSFWQSFGLFVVWPVCIYFLFNKRIQTLIAVLYSILLICGVINTYIFKGSYGTMDITLKFIGGIYKHGNRYLLSNLAAIVMIIEVLFIIYRLKFGFAVSAASFIMVFAFASLGAINVRKINREYKEFQVIAASGEDSSDIFKKQFHLTKNKKNLVLIMLDRAESSFFESIVNDFPALKDQYSGFTFYPNTVSANGHTLMGVPAVYGGYDYLPSEINKREDVPLKDKHNEALMLLPKILTEQASFNATLTDLSWANYSYVSDMSFAQGIENIDAKKLRGRYTGDFKKEFTNELGNTNLEDSIKRNLIWIGFFREAPACIRPIIYYKEKGTWWTDEDVADMDGLLDWFAELYYLPEITDFSSFRDNLIVITNEATHSTEDSKKLNLFPENKLSHPDVSAYDTNAVCLLTIARWLDSLKENDAYDNTRIVIVADHGMGSNKLSEKLYTTQNIGGYSKDHLNPLLLVKDFNAKGQLKTDMSFMTNADTPAILLKDIIENPTNPYTKNPITSAAKDDGILVTIDDLFMPYHSKNKNIFTVKNDSWYRIRDNIFIDSNWQKAE